MLLLEEPRPPCKEPMTAWEARRRARLQGVRSRVGEAADRGVSQRAWCDRVFAMPTEKNVMRQRQPAAHNRVARAFCEDNVTAY